MRRGWPKPQAVIVAAALHAAAIGWLLLPERHGSPPVPPAERIPVTLVMETPPDMAPPAPPAPVLAPTMPDPGQAETPFEAAGREAPENGGNEKAASPPAPEKPAEATGLSKAKRPRAARADRPRTSVPGSMRFSTPSRHVDDPSAEPGQAKPWHGTVPDAPPAPEEPQQTQDEVAVYDVLVGAGGSVQAIRLTHSSGSSGYDEAGASMIRNTMSFDAPPASASATVVMTVTIHFSPESR